MSTHELLIDELLKARRNNIPLSFQRAIDLAPATENDAYKVQISIAQELGWFQESSPKLWKLGGSSGKPNAAALAVSSLQNYSAKEPLIIDSGDECTFTGLELELAVKLKKTLKNGDSLKDAVSAIGEVYLALEVCDQRACEWQKLPNLFRLADHQMNRKIILFGDPLSKWSDELTHISPTIKLGGDTINSKVLTHPQGHPLKALPWLAQHSQRLYKQPLTKGTIIATGTWFGMQLISKSKSFQASLKGFSDIEVLLT